LKKRFSSSERQKGGGEETYFSAGRDEREHRWDGPKRRDQKYGFYLFRSEGIGGKVGPSLLGTDEKGGSAPLETTT